MRKEMRVERVCDSDGGARENEVAVSVHHGHTDGLMRVKLVLADELLMDIFGMVHLEQIRRNRHDCLSTCSRRRRSRV